MSPVYCTEIQQKYEGNDSSIPRNSEASSSVKLSSGKQNCSKGGCKMHEYVAVCFIRIAHLQTKVLWVGRKNRARASFGGNCHYSTAKKALWVYITWERWSRSWRNYRHAFQRGRTVGLIHISNFPKFHSHETSNSELISSLIIH